MEPRREPAGRENAADGVRAFARRARQRMGLAAMAQRALQLGLPAALGVLVLLWLLPTAAPLAAVVLGAGLALALAVTFARARHARLDLLAVGGAGTAEGPPPRLQDDLATWLERDARGEADGAMVRWLCTDLAGEIAALQPKAVKAIGRRRPGRIRYLIPVLVLGLLCWLLLKFTLPPIPGLLGGGPGAGSGGSGGGGTGGAGSNPQGQGQQGEPDNEPKPPTRLPDPLPVPDEPEPPPVVEQEPAPLLDLPTLPRIVVPQFTGDGPTRKAMAHRALVGDDGGGAAPKPKPQPPPGQSGGELPPPAGPQPDEFERAAERAQRARHVPPEEQAMVRRFFELLRKEAK